MIKHQYLFNETINKEYNFIKFICCLTYIGCSCNYVTRTYSYLDTSTVEKSSMKTYLELSFDNLDDKLLFDMHYSFNDYIQRYK